MTPLEELQAAHNRLSELRKESDQYEGGPWGALPSEERAVLSTIGSEIGGQLAYGRHEVLYDAPTADLIVTLHSTIDAQLAVLAGASGRASRFERGTEWQIIQRQVREIEPDALALARAINGGSHDAA